MQRLVDKRDLSDVLATIERLKQKSKEYEWTVRAPDCAACDDLRFKEVADSTEVIPCSGCNTDLYDKWRNGKVNENVRRKTVHLTPKTPTYEEHRRKDLF